MNDETNRYNVKGMEGTYQPGSNGLVLANKLEITDPAELNQVELELLEQLYIEVLESRLPSGMITVDTIKEWHRRWLGNVYEWAGYERSVTLSKGGFAFAAATQIPKLLVNFQRDCLQRFTPCDQLDLEGWVERAVLEV